MDITKIISPEEYYLNIAKIKIASQTEDEWNTCCPFHDDKHKSFSINKNTGLWKCFGNCGAGNLVQYHAKDNNLTDDEALVDLKVTKGIQKSVPAEQVKTNHARLLKAKAVLDFLKTRRGLTLETIKRFELGFDGERIWIPIKIGNHYLNIRRYRWQPGGTANDKMLSYDVGYGDARLFPHSNLAKPGPLLLCEGEMDCILANQLGYLALTVTGGAGTWTSGFSTAVAGRQIAICYDIDEAGHKGSDKVCKAVVRIVKEIRNVKLPLTEPANADFTNYIVDNGYKKADFDELLSKSEVFKVPGGSEAPLDPNVYQVPLNEASSEKYYLKQVEMKVIVSGKDLAPYFVPHHVQLSCGMGMKKCNGCGLGPNGSQGEYKLDITHPADMLQLIGVTDAAQKTFLKQKAKIMQCSVVKLETKSAYNIEQVRLIPEIEYASRDTEYVTREVFVMGHGIKTNSSYLMRGVTIPDPKTQYATQVIQERSAMQLSIDHFAMTPELKKQMEVFQPGKLSIKEKLKEIHEDLTHNVTQIYKREDIQRVIDLVYHSVLQFKFLGRLVTKGRVEGLVLGDTRCGKSETVEKMIAHYHAGELVTGENTSYAGLIGGMQQTQQRWSISWGKIPLNDRRLIAIDEVSGLHVDQISLMSGVRSSGIAEIVKIQSEKTYARTRLLWLSNSRSGRRLDTYNHGVMAIKELIGRTEDVARFDIATIAASGEVPVSVMFELKDKKVKHQFTTELCNKLVLWAWSRTPDQIHISKETEAEIYKSVNILDDKYSSAIPLVEPAEQRIKLARMATSLACRLFSTEDGETVIVTPAHVREIVDFLQEVFDKPSMGYDMFSANMKKADKVPECDLAEIQKEFRLFHNWTLLRDILLQMTMFKKNELTDQLGYDQDQSRLLFGWLGKRRLIRSAPFGYIKQVAFTEMLKGMLEEKEEHVASKF